MGTVPDVESGQQEDPLNFFIYPYLEVDGKKHDGVEGKLEYADSEDSKAIP